MPLQIASFKEMKPLAKRVARKLKADYTEIIQKTFPDNELYIKIKKDPVGKDFVLIDSFAKQPNIKIVRAILTAGAAKESGAKKTTLVAAYLPYMRQDKQFTPHESVSSKQIVKTLSQHFDKLYAIDPHLHRIRTLEQISKNAHSITLNRLIADYIKKNFNGEATIVGPDSESSQWAGKIAAITENDALILKKKRFSSIKVKIKEEPLGKDIIIIDDIISTGRTVLETIKIARKFKARKITVIGIHGLFQNNAEKLITKHAVLISTNTIPSNYSKIDVSPLIAETLSKIDNH